MSLDKINWCKSQLHLWIQVDHQTLQLTNLQQYLQRLNTTGHIIKDSLKQYKSAFSKNSSFPTFNISSNHFLKYILFYLFLTLHKSRCVLQIYKFTHQYNHADLSKWPWCTFPNHMRCWKCVNFLRGSCVLTFLWYFCSFILCSHYIRRFLTLFFPLSLLIHRRTSAPSWRRWTLTSLFLACTTGPLWSCTADTTWERFPRTSSPLPTSATTRCGRGCKTSVSWSGAWY